MEFTHSWTSPRALLGIFPELTRFVLCTFVWFRRALRSAVHAGALVLGSYSSFLADCKDLVDFMFRSGTREIRRENKEKKRREGVWRKVQKQGSLRRCRMGPPPPQAARELDSLVCVCVHAPRVANRGVLKRKRGTARD